MEVGVEGWRRDGEGMEGRKDEWRDGGIEGLREGWEDGGVDRGLEGWMDRWMLALSLSPAGRWQARASSADPSCHRLRPS